MQLERERTSLFSVLSLRHDPHRSEIPSSPDTQPKKLIMGLTQVNSDGSMRAALSTAGVAALDKPVQLPAQWTGAPSRGAKLQPSRHLFATDARGCVLG
jgi:hypothetical protein